MQKKAVEIKKKPDFRDLERPGKLPCGAKACYHCVEDCGVVVNVWIMRDWHDESPAPGLAPAQKLPPS